ncbi:MAG: sulfatase-like hydrolase/transferase, partial [Ferruginibacter sp.]
MLSKIWFIVRYWFCWIFFFEIARLGFLLKNFTVAKAAGLHSSLLSLWYGARMDMSMAAYLTVAVALIISFSVFFRGLQRPIIFKSYTAIILLIVLLLTVIDVNLFNAWGYRIDASFIKYLSNPKEAYASMAYLPILWIIIFFIVGYLLIRSVFNKIILQGLKNIKPDRVKLISFIFLLLVTGLFIIPIRGGLQWTPLNQSSVYFSQNNFANLAALNGPWNFVYSLNENNESAENPFQYLDKKQAGAKVESLYSHQINTSISSSLQKKNIIIVVWESFTEKATRLQIEGHGITPGFNALKKEGIYFSNIYATGDRTDKGIVGVLSGYPAQPLTSIVKIPVKASKLPMLSTQFSNAGYHTAFYYGGELEFANIKAYLLGGSFNNFISITDFDKKDQNSKWGAHDGVVMQKIMTDLNKQPQPFFYTWLTLSSHEPFETPVPQVLSGKDVPSLFLNSLHYTDSTLYDFVQQSKKQPWWNNTIMVIVADHGHRLPATGKRLDDFKIPLLFLGGSLNKTGITIDKIGSQIDLPATLLGQLGLPYQSFKWSKNLLDTTCKPWAYFSFNNGFGFVQPGKSFLYDNVGNSIIEKQGPITGQDVNTGKALEQISFQDYLDK